MENREYYASMLQIKFQSEHHQPTDGRNCYCNCYCNCVCAIQGLSSGVLGLKHVDNKQIGVNGFLDSRVKSRVGPVVSHSRLDDTVTTPLTQTLASTCGGIVNID